MKFAGRLKCALGAVLVIVSTLNICGVSTASAAEDKPKQWLQVSPSTIEMDEMKPGETYTTTLKVQNIGSENLKYELGISPYSVNVQDGKYSSNYTTENNYNMISKWATFSQDSGEIEPSKQDVVTATIKIPKDVPSGGQYASIYVRIASDKDKADGSAVNAISQVSVILYGSVEGNTRKEGKVLENKVPSFMFTPPISATSIVENTGNVHFEAKYILQVYPLFGGEEVYTNEENPTTAVIMPETQRLNTVSWEGAPQLGIFKIKQTVKFLDQENVTEKVLFICPIWFLLIVLVVIFLIIFFIVSRVFGGKKGE